MTTTLVNHQQIHQILPGRAFLGFRRMADEQRRASNGGRPRLLLHAATYRRGNHQSFAGVYGMIQQQASMLAFNDIYRVLAIWMVLLIPSFLLLRRGAASSSAAH